MNAIIVFSVDAQPVCRAWIDTFFFHRAKGNKINCTVVPSACTISFDYRCNVWRHREVEGYR